MSRVEERAWHQQQCSLGVFGSSEKKTTLTFKFTTPANVVSTAVTWDEFLPREPVCTSANSVLLPTADGGLSCRKHAALIVNNGLQKKYSGRKTIWSEKRSSWRYASRDVLLCVSAGLALRKRNSKSRSVFSHSLTFRSLKRYSRIDHDLKVGWCFSLTGTKQFIKLRPRWSRHSLRHSRCTMLSFSGGYEREFTSLRPPNSSVSEVKREVFWLMHSAFVRPYLSLLPQNKLNFTEANEGRSRIWLGAPWRGNSIANVWEYFETFETIISELFFGGGSICPVSF